MFGIALDNALAIGKFQVSNTAAFPPPSSLAGGTSSMPIFTKVRSGDFSSRYRMETADMPSSGVNVTTNKPPVPADARQTFGIDREVFGFLIEPHKV
jgi:hypothetical protein